MISNPNYIHFYLHAKNKYRLHSPLLYGFAMEVLEDRNTFYADLDIKRLLSLIRAANPEQNSYSQSLTIYKRLFRISKWYQPESIISITNRDMGLSAISAYFGSRNAKLYLADKDKSYTTLLIRHFSLLKIEKQIDTIQKDISELKHEIGHKSLIITSAEVIESNEISKVLIQNLYQETEYCILIYDLNTSVNRQKWLDLVQKTHYGFHFIDIFSIGIILKMDPKAGLTYTPIISFNKKCFQI